MKKKKILNKILKEVKKLNNKKDKKTKGFGRVKESDLNFIFKT